MMPLEEEILLYGTHTVLMTIDLEHTDALSFWCKLFDRIKPETHNLIYSPTTVGGLRSR